MKKTLNGINGRLGIAGEKLTEFKAEQQKLSKIKCEEKQKKQ